MTKKAGKTAAVAAPVSEAQIGILTHTARMQMVISRNEKHPRRKEYDRQMAAYAGQWAGLSDVEKKSVAAAAAEIHDMTPKIVAAAVAALEE